MLKLTTALDYSHCTNITRKSMACNYMLYKGVVDSKINNHFSIVHLGLIFGVDELDGVSLSIIHYTPPYPWRFVKS